MGALSLLMIFHFLSYKLSDSSIFLYSYMSKVFYNRLKAQRHQMREALQSLFKDSKLYFLACPWSPCPDSDLSSGSLERRWLCWGHELPLLWPGQCFHPGWGGSMHASKCCWSISERRVPRQHRDQKMH